MALINFILGIASLVWSGFVISKLWGWFLVPLGVVSIGIFWGSGIHLTARALIGYGSADLSVAVEESDDLEKTLGRIIADTFLYGACLLFGWILSHLAF
jgi:hypothetical protein